MTSYRHFRIIVESYRTLYEDFCIREIDRKSERTEVSRVLSKSGEVQLNSVKILYVVFLINIYQIVHQ